MSLLESEIRRSIASTIAPKIGANCSLIKEIIHHSSTRRPAGALEDSDIDLTLIIDHLDARATFYAFPNITNRIAQVIKPSGLSLGEGPLQVHLSIYREEDFEDRQGQNDEISSRIILETRSKGNIDYQRDY